MKLLFAVMVCAVISVLAYLERGCFAIGGEMFVQFAWIAFVTSIGLEK